MLPNTRHILPRGPRHSGKRLSTLNLPNNVVQKQNFHIQTQSKKAPLLSTWLRAKMYGSPRNKRDDIMQKVWQKRQERLTKATSNILQKLADNSVRFESAQLYIRKAGSFDNTDAKAQKVHIALRGIAHTAVVLKCSKNKAYLLDRVVEGIRLIELKVNPETKTIENCDKFKVEEMIKISPRNQVDLCSMQVAEWIKMESQRKYHVLTNSCVQFALYFYMQFCGNLPQFISQPMVQLNDIKQ